MGAGERLSGKTTRPCSQTDCHPPFLQVEAYQAHLGLAAPGSGGEGELAALVDCFGSGEDEQAVSQ